MSYVPSPEDKSVMYDAVRVSAILSVIGALLVIFQYLSERREHRKLARKLVCLMSCNDFVVCVCYSMGNWLFDDSVACKIEGFIQQFVLSNVLWNACIATNMFLRIVQEKSERVCNRFEPYYYLFSWGFPLITCIAVLLVDGYGPALLWCWISGRFPQLRLICFFIPLWVIIIYHTTLMVLIVRKIVGVRSNSTTRRNEIYSLAFRGFAYTSVFYITVS